MSAKTIENSHANLQSCFKEMCQAAIRIQCQVISTFHAEFLCIIIFAVLLYCKSFILFFSVCKKKKKVDCCICKYLYILFWYLFVFVSFFLQANKEGDLLHRLFTKPIPWPVVSSIIVESAARFGEDHEGCLLDSQSAINFLLSQGAMTGSYKLHGFNMV